MIGSARYWREVPQRYRYEAAKCVKCGEVFFPPRLVCNGCGGREFTKQTLEPNGSVETFTIIQVAPTGFEDQAPYAVGVIKLDDGVKLTAQIVDCDPESLAVGDRVRLEFRRVQQDGESGILCYGYKFVPVAK
ncbi:MAG: transcriptional regulator [Candidatus Eisenbacteria bacterium]|nr:transcriptional regulator [Candidatus Latescibacterota bacterium]MBD3302418.1 transcriptional regulator [Candidatus Eisenbacteria bacterium]